MQFAIMGVRQAYSRSDSLTLALTSISTFVLSLVLTLILTVSIYFALLLVQVLQAYATSTGLISFSGLSLAQNYQKPSRRS